MSRYPRGAYRGWYRGFQRGYQRRGYQRQPDIDYMQMKEDKREISRTIYEKKDKIASCLPYNADFFKTGAESQFRAIAPPFFCSQRPVAFKLVNYDRFYFPGSWGGEASGAAAMKAIEMAQGALGHGKVKELLCNRYVWVPKFKKKSYIHGIQTAEMLSKEREKHQGLSGFKLELAMLLESMGSCSYKAFQILKSVLEDREQRVSDYYALVSIAWWMFRANTEQSKAMLATLVRLMLSLVDVNELSEEQARDMLAFISDNTEWMYNHYDPRAVSLCGVSNFLPNGSGWGVLAKVKSQKAKSVRGEFSISLGGVFVSAWTKVIDKDAWISAIDALHAQCTEILNHPTEEPTDEFLVDTMLDPIMRLVYSEIAKVDAEITRRLDEQLPTAEGLIAEQMRALKAAGFAPGVLEAMMTNGELDCDTMYPQFLESMHLDEDDKNLSDVYGHLRQRRMEKLRANMAAKSEARLGGTFFSSQSI